MHFIYIIWTKESNCDSLLHKLSFMKRDFECSLLFFANARSGHPNMHATTANNCSSCITYKRCIHITKGKRFELLVYWVRCVYFAMSHVLPWQRESKHVRSIVWRCARKILWPFFILLRLSAPLGMMVMLMTMLGIQASDFSESFEFIKQTVHFFVPPFTTQQSSASLFTLCQASSFSFSLFVSRSIWKLCVYVCMQYDMENGKLQPTEALVISWNVFETYLFLFEKKKKRKSLLAFS